MTLAAPLLDYSRRIGRFEFPIEQTRAFADAARNYESNRAALEAVWPRTLLCLPESLPELEWLYARDGALSARHIDRQWFGQVSVPQKSAQKMLGKAIVTGSSAVLLAPTHAQQIRTVLNRMTRQQVLLVVLPGEFTAGVILACEDFSSEIRGQRLWIAAGPEWGEELIAILEKQDGIAPASMMIRVPGLNADTVERTLKPCEQILSKNSQTHRNHLTLLHTKPRQPSRPIRKLCVVTGSFKLWDDAPFLLGQAITQTSLKTVVLDSSIPTQCSALKVARSADGCDALLTANLARADLPLVIPANVPWITWVTGNRTPDYVQGATVDRLIVAEEVHYRAAIARGWPESQVLVGHEPVRAPAASRTAQIAIFADLPSVTMPKSVEDLSSQRLVWDRVEHEVSQNALCIGSSPDEYLYRLADEVGIARSAFPLVLFRTELLVPTFIRAFAKQLHARGTRFSIHGSGWDALPELEPHARGPIESADAFAAALAGCSGILDVWPGEVAHPARRAGRPILKPWGRDWPALAREINRTSISTMNANAVGRPFDLQRVLDSI